MGFYRRGGLNSQDVRLELSVAGDDVAAELHLPATCQPPMLIANIPLADAIRLAAEVAAAAQADVAIIDPEGLWPC